MLDVNYKALLFLVEKRNKLVKSDIVSLEVSSPDNSGEVSAKLIFPNRIRCEDCAIFFTFLLDIEASFFVAREAWRIVVSIK